jgi:hypothetical protein
MDGIYCAECGAELRETLTLLPHQRSPCPTCGSQARKITRTVRSSILPMPGVPPATVERIISADAVVHAPTAEAVAEAPPPAVQTVEAYSIPVAGRVGNPTVVRDPRIIRDHLVVMGRSLWWTQLTEEGGWMVQVVDEAGEVLAVSTKYDPIEALASVAEFVVPGHPG